MKRLSILLFLFISLNEIIAQPIFKQNVEIRNIYALDTTSTTFKEIFKFWTDYKHDQFYDFATRHDSTKKRESLKYWADDEFQNGEEPDMIYGTVNVPYILFDEYFMGIEKRNDTLYEFQTMLFGNWPSEHIPQGIYTFCVSKTDADYKFHNKFTLYKPFMKKYKSGWITYYYPDNYVFNRSAADKTYRKAKSIAKKLGLKEVKPIDYYLFNTLTNKLQSYGIYGSILDFQNVDNVIFYGHSMTNCRKIDYTKDGEKITHEILHILLHDLRKGKEVNMHFDEGFCCYFGNLDPFHSIEYQLKRLKEFLNTNTQIDLSIDLWEAYKDKDGKFTHDSISSVEGFKISYGDYKTNYAYMIQAVLCEMLYKKGGMDLVKQMLLTTPNNDAIYASIEKYLGIKQGDVNQVIRDYLNKNY